MWTCRSPPYQPSAAGSKRRGGSTSTRHSPSGTTSRSTTPYSRPRVQVTVSAAAGTVSVTSSAWKNGRPRTSHLCSTPSGNHAPPVASVTDQRAQRGARRRSRAQAVARRAAASDTGSPSTVTGTPGRSTSMVATPAPRAATVSASPATTAATSRSTAASTTTSSGIGTPATTGRAGPQWTSVPPSVTRTTTTPAGGAAPTTARTARGQSPVCSYAAKTSPSAAN